ncbi:toll-like receptor 4 [Lytechinus variegatus]|uniref:toll-like receptor 4 n=1 Tax=Lytechinus variegatus TaxID=7654 RepID=UPI001BB0FB3C|nr:toll-like receptor 4 [Lytechinus variegatus]
MATSTVLHPLLLVIITSSLQSVHGIVRNSPTVFTEKPLHGCDYDMVKKEVSCNYKQLDDVPQNFPRDTKYLDLSYNQITILLNSSFNVYPLISHLIIVQNDVRSIDSAALYPLKFLRYLDLSKNFRLLLPVTDIFLVSSKLSHLDLIGSNLTSFPNNMLKSTTHLRLLRLTANYLSFINVSSCSKVDAVYLSNNRIQRLTAEDFIFPCQTDSLSLVGNPIQFVESTVIASLKVHSLRLGGYPLSNEVLSNIILGISMSKNIKELGIFGGSIGTFPKYLFDSLCNYSLSVLTFKENHLKNLHPFVFSNLTTLKQLIIIDNYVSIDNIQPNFFDGMHALEVLNMSNNGILQINPSNQNWTLNVTHINLRKNALRTLFVSAFHGLRNLILLDLRENNLVELTLTAFSRLRSLYLNNIENPYGVLRPGESFLTLKSLVDLRLRHGYINGAILFNTEEKVSLFDGLSNLRFLDLSENQPLGIVLPHDVFRQLSALQELTLDDCHIRHINPLLFLGLRSLQKLSLKENRITQLSYEFMFLFHLTDINLNGNVISYLGPSTFSTNKKLSIISLAHNQLTNLDQRTIKPIIFSIVSLDLSNNPIICDCDLNWLVGLLNKNLHLAQEDNTHCSQASLKPFRLKPLTDFDPNDICTNINVFSLLAPLSVCCLLFIILVVFRNRWHLKYKIFLLKLAVFGYKEIRDARDHNDFEYDINIMFYDDDEEWIREHLRPALEENLPQFQRNVFGDEGLVLGMHYLDAVDHAVTHSYKTIIVLSRAAVRDHWFILKFRTAMDHVSDTLTEFVLVIFLEDIPDDEVPFLVRLYLSDGRPYINWTDDVRGHEYFWNELSKRLTINLRTNDMIPNE